VIKINVITTDSQPRRKIAMIRAIIWDMGGVLLRTIDPAPRIKLAAQLGLSRQDIEKTVFEDEWSKKAEIGEITTEERNQHLMKALGITGNFEDFEKEFWGGDRLDSDLVEYIKKLRHTYQTALLSNAWDNLRANIQHRWKIADIFDEMIISAEVGMAKPDPRIYQLALSRLKVSPEEAVFIDDFERNIIGAQTVGLHTIHFKTVTQTRMDLDILLKDNH
jgi:epoxide hydrolase-like predicted phosphatase